MSSYQIHRLARLHKKAERHANEYKMLSGERSAQSKALWHLQKAVPALQTAYQELQDIIEFLPDATMVLDPEKKVIYRNRAMEEMTGVGKKNILGKSDYAICYSFSMAKRGRCSSISSYVKPEIEKRYDFVKR